jgi:hypothetical protein
VSQHRFEVRGGLSLLVIQELAAVVTDGLVEQEEVGEGTFLFSFVQLPDCVEIQARLRHPQSETPFYRAFNPLFNLMAGLLEAGCQVRVEGPWADKLPNGVSNQPTLALRSIFQHNLTPEERLPDLTPADVEQAVLDLPTRSNYTHRGDREFCHSNGIVMLVLFNKAHRIDGREPLSCRLMTDYFDQGPLPAGSWGEVWIGYWVRLGQGRPFALHIFPDEIALVSDIQVHRYRIEDRSTLRDLSVLDFGKGPPLLHKAEAWLGFAEQCGERSDYQMALRCCEQARLCASPQEAARVAEETAHWEEWQAYLPQSQPQGAEPVFASLDDLIAIVGHGEQLKALADEIAWELHEAESYRRQPRSLAHVLEYPVVTGHQLLAAGVTPRTLDWLGLGSGPIARPARYNTIFQIGCGDWTIWGTVPSGYLLLREDPSVLYRISMP